MLKRFADVCLNALPLELCPDCGIDDMNYMRLEASTKPILIPPY